MWWARTAPLTPVARDVVPVVIRARVEEICRLAIPVEEILGDRPYEPPKAVTTRERAGD